MPDFGCSPKKLLLPPYLFALFICCIAGFSRASDILVCRLLNPQGTVSVLPSGKDSWEGALNGRDLFAGDSIKTGSDSRVAVLCIDETQLKLNENTLVVLKSATPSPRMGVAVPASQEETGASLYEVREGEIWLRNKNDKARFEVHTPAVTVAIRGTEFNLKVDRTGATNLVLLEGRLTMANSQGQVDLDPGEEGFAEVGMAPVKRVILQPKDAVQWSLYYPGIFSYRDIPLSMGGGTNSAPQQQGTSARVVDSLACYNRGDLDESERYADEELARDPENGPALMVLGWICLNRQDPQKARDYFERAVRHGAPPGLVVSGLALASYRKGDSVRAYKLMIEELNKGHPSSLTIVMSGYFSMLAGKVDQAKELLADSRIGGTDSAMAHSLLAQMYLIQNSKERACAEAAAALEANRESPMAKMTCALVKISYFDLPEAGRLLEEAIAADPRFVEAYVYLARLRLGGDYLDRAWGIICKAMEISKTDSEVLSLAGFIRLGYRDYDQAFKLFTEAAINNPGFGEPHIGLANIAFKNRNFSLGLIEMLTATLLEPRVSLYQSSLGKALYQTKSFTKALEVYDYAKTLDPHDPTPYLYKGIALSDLYRPGEAIQEINKSIELNDNTAVFRSRLMLDRDLAVRNTDLANAYYMLGMSEWSYSKALTAVKKDPLNPSAHLFLSLQYSSTQQRVLAAGSELLLYRLLSPANENTFSLDTDYTQMFEMPYTRFALTAGAGTWADHLAPSQEYSIEALGGLPGLAVDAFGAYVYDPGFRKANEDTTIYYAEVMGKYEPTIKDSLYADYSYYRGLEGDTTNLGDYSYINSLTSRTSSNEYSYEGGFVHRFNPQAVFIGYFNWGKWDWMDRNSNFFFTNGGGYLNAVFFNYQEPVIWESSNLQLQQQLKLGDHTFIGGVQYITGSYFSNYQASGVRNIYLPFEVLSWPYSYDLEYNPPDRSASFYIHDYWLLSPPLLVELGLSGDSVRSYRETYPFSVSSTNFNPSVGLNYEIDNSNTLRLAYQGYPESLKTATSSTISPTEVAGFPSLINAPQGSQIKELGVSWESQWNQKTFTVLGVQAYRIEDPEYDRYSNQFDSRTESAGGSLAVNRLLASSIGLSAKIAGSVISMESPPEASLMTGAYREIDGRVGLFYMHPKGWFASINDTVVSQYLADLGDYSDEKEAARSANPFNLVDMEFGKYFDNKRGYAALAVTNIFNQHFYYQTEPYALWNFYPDREIVFTLALYF
jgi:tetratricopeptide (TPR) repeat protein